MANFYHVSDIHLDDDHEENSDIALALAKLAQATGPDDRLVVTGDLTKSGTVKQFQEAARVLAPWRGRLLVCVGNHDECAFGIFWYSDADKRWTRLEKQLGLQTVYREAGSLIYCVDTTLHSQWDLARGRVGILQRRKLRNYAAEAKKNGLHFDVVMHHSLLDHSKLELLEDAELVRKILIGQARYVFCGHEHAHKEWGSGGTMVISADTFRECLKPLVWER